MTAPVRVTVPRPSPPKYIPGKCYALKHRYDPKTHCMESARFYPVGWRCDFHAPGALKTTRETSPTRMEHAA
jgi:hypothetical protein